MKNNSLSLRGEEESRFVFCASVWVCVFLFFNPRGDKLRPLLLTLALPGRIPPIRALGSKWPTVRFRGMGTGISEASKSVPIFSFATQGGKQVSSHFRQGTPGTRTKLQGSDPAAWSRA